MSRRLTRSASRSEYEPEFRMESPTHASARYGYPGPRSPPRSPQRGPPSPDPYFLKPYGQTWNQKYSPELQLSDGEDPASKYDDTARVECVSRANEVIDAFDRSFGEDDYPAPSLDYYHHHAEAAMAEALSHPSVEQAAKAFIHGHHSGPHHAHSSSHSHRRHREEDVIHPSQIAQISQFHAMNPGIPQFDAPSSFPEHYEECHADGEDEYPGPNGADLARVTADLDAMHVNGRHPSRRGHGSSGHRRKTAGHKRSDRERDHHRRRSRP